MDTGGFENEGISTAMMSAPTKTVRGVQRIAGLFIAMAMILGVTSCSDSTQTRSSARNSSSESFLAIRASWDGSSNRLFEGADIATFALSDKQIVPDVRVARSSAETQIGVFPSTRETDADYFGYPLTADGQFIVWSRSGQRDELDLVNPGNGIRTKLHAGTAFRSVSYFQDLGTLVVNSDVCIAVRPDGEVRRVGKGQCVGTSLGLRLVEQSPSSLTISVIDETLQVSDRRSFPVRDAALSARGALVSGRSIGSGSLTVFELSTGRKLWTSKASDFQAEVLSTAKSGDSLLIAQDSDDNDNLVDLFSIRVDETGPSIKKLLSSRLVSAQLSSDGTSVMIATRVSSSGAYAYRTENLVSGESSELGYEGEPSGLALSSTNFYAFASGGTLYIGSFGSAPRRALDIFGEVTGLVEVVAESTFLVLTDDSGQAGITIVRNSGDAPKAKLILSVLGRLTFDPQLGSRNDVALVTATDDDGYGTLYEVSLTDKFDTRRLAEGNIRWFTYGPNENIFYGDVLNGEMTVFLTKSADKPSRTLVSTRYVVIRQGRTAIRETNSGFLGTMQAYLDPTLDFCKKQRLPLIALAEGSTALTLNAIGMGGPASLCIQVSPQARGSLFDLSLSPADTDEKGTEPFDSAFELLSSAVGNVEPISSADSLDIVATADDAETQADSRFSYESRLLKQEFLNPTYLLRGYSWTRKASAVLRVSKPTETAATLTSFSRDDWKSRFESYKDCMELPSLIAGREPGEELTLTVGVEKNGDAEIKRFCLSIPRSFQQAKAEYALYLIADDTEDAVAQLALGCSKAQARQTPSGRPFETLSSPRDIIGFESRISGFGLSPNITIAVFQLPKGFTGPCYLTHQSPRPAEGGAATRARVRMALERTD